MAFANFFQSGTLRRNLVPAAVAVVIGGIAWIGIGPILSGDAEDSSEPVPEVPEPVEAEAPPLPIESPGADRHAPAPVYPSVLVANRNIPSGMLLTSEFVEWRTWKEPLDVNLAVVEGVVPIRAVVGAVTRRRFREGSMISWDGLLMPGHPGFISAVLTPAMSAVTVEVDRPTTEANIIYPGDRVRRHHGVVGYRRGHRCRVSHHRPRLPGAGRWFDCVVTGSLRKGQPDPGR